MGAGCCRAHILPGQHAGAPPPRPAWGPAWGTTAPDHSIASLRPGDKFHFHREPFIRQHLVVPDKPFSANGAKGVHNKAFTSDGGELTIRPASRRALPSLSTPEPSPTPAPVPPPRKKRRARPAQPLGQPHGLQGLPGDAPPQPPSRTRAGSRQRDGDDDAERDPSDSILSPANTMELLQRMAKVDARAGVRRPGPAWRSMDSLDAVELRGRSLPGRGTASTTTASRFSTASSQQGYLTQSTEALDGPRSLDLNLDREGVVGVAAFTLQSWDERGSSSASAATRPWSPPLSTSAALLSPRQWRPVSPLSAGRASPQQTQTATTRAMSDFIRDSYAARSDGADAVVPSEQEAAAVADTAEAEAGGTKALPEQKTLDSPEGRAAEGHPVGQPVIELEGLDSVAPDARRGRSAAASDVTPVSASTPSPSKSAGLLDVAAADGRPASAASSTTESLGELENDILHMLSSSGPASARADAADAADAEESAQDRDQDRDEGAGEAESNNNGPVLQKHRPTALDSAPLSA